MDPDLAGGKKRNVSKYDALLVRQPLRSRSRGRIVQSDEKQEARADVWDRNIRSVHPFGWQNPSEEREQDSARFRQLPALGASGWKMFV